MPTIRTREISKPAPITGTNSRSLYNTLGNGMYLHENSTYTIHLNVKGLSNVFTFTSAYTPIYSTVRDVRTGIGNALDKYSESEIWDVIRDNTVYLQENVSDEYTTDDESVDPVTGSDYTMRQWVKIKSQIDCIYGSYAMTALHLGSETHVLGFLNVQHSTKLPGIDDLLKRLEDDLRELEVALFGFHPRTAVKGGTSYPYAPNRNSF